MSRTRRVSVVGYASALAVLAAVLAWRLVGVEHPPGEVSWLALPAFGALIAAAEYLLVRFRYRDEVNGLNLVEAALAPLIFAFPAPAVVLAVASGQLIAGVLRRNDPVKLYFNVAQWSLAGAAGAGMVALIEPAAGINPSSVAAVVAALAAVWLVNNSAFVTVLVLASGQPVMETLRGFRPVIIQGWLGAWTVNVLLGVLYVLAYAAHPVAVVLFPVPLVVLHLAYRGHTVAAADRQRLVGLHLAGATLARAIDPTDSLDDFLRQVVRCYGARVAELVLRDGDVLVVHRHDGTRHNITRVPPDLLSLEAALVVLPTSMSITAGHEGLATLLESAGHRDCLAAPLTDGERTIGALAVFDLAGMETRPAGQLAVLEAMAREVVGAFERARLLQTVVEERFAHARLERAGDRQRSVIDALQEAIMPSCPEVAGASVGVAYAPSDASAPTGGDLYDCRVLPSGELHVVAVDVLGHGVEATRDALNVIHTLRVLAVDGTPLEDLITRADALIGQQHPDLVATVVACRFDPRSGFVRVASGGHPPALVVTAGGEVTQLPAPGGAIGWPGAGSERVVTTRLGPHDSLVLYTDGLVEARKDILEGMESLVRHAADTARLSPQEMADVLLERSLAGAVRRDDSLALVLRREPVSAPMAVERWEIPPEPQAIGALRLEAASWLAERAIICDELTLVVSELLTNAVRAARSQITMSLQVATGAVVVEVADDGPGDPSLSSETVGTSMPTAQEEAGRGFAIVRAISETVDVLNTPDGMLVSVRLSALTASGGPEERDEESGRHHLDDQHQQPPLRVDGSRHG